MNRVRLRFHLWSAAVVVLFAVFGFGVLPNFHLETNILALLPPSASDLDSDVALEQFTNLLGRNVVFLIGDPQFDKAKAAAKTFAARLSAAPDGFAKVRLEVDPNALQELGAGYVPFRDELLSDRMRALLAAGNDDQVLAQARQALYSPAAFMRRSGPGEDPLNLFGDFLMQTTPATGQMGLRDSLLVTEAPATATSPGTSYVMVSAVLKDNAFDSSEQAAAGPVLDAAIAEARAQGVSVNGSGLLQHSLAAHRMAEDEMKLFGGIQFAGLAAVLWYVFRSGRVLLLAGATLGIGMVAALTVSHYVFEKLHVVTLVFCSNLAGVAIDYCIYFCADQFRPADASGRPWQARDALRNIGPAITMSCAAAVLSYALLAVAPFPGLRQAAVFCCMGLAAAYGCVMCWFPRWVLPAPPAPAQRLVAQFERLSALRARHFGGFRPWLWLGVAVVVALGLARVRFDDDVRVLQPSDSDLLAQETVVRDRIGGLPDARFYLVRAATPEAVLRAEEDLRPRLDALVAAHHLASYSAVSEGLPSAQRQADNHRLLAERVFGSADAAGPGSLAARFMQELGFDEPMIAARLAAFAATPAPLTVEPWLASSASEPFRHQWLGNIASPGHAPEYASIVTLSGAVDADALQQVAEGLRAVTFVDRLAQFTRILQRYRQRAMLLVSAAAVASALLLSLGYGLRQGVLLMLVPSAACCATLAVLGWMGVSLSFFHVVALHLVMGLGMEYAILLQVPQLDSPSVLLSSTLAAALALLAFGLLALSSTPFIHSIGMTVSIGVFIGFAFAFCTGRLRARRIA